MATAYTSLLGLALPVTGELSGTWGDTVNNYITSYLDAAVAGAQTISGTQTAVTLSVTNGSSLVQAGGAGSTGSSQYQIINCTGNPAGLLTITVPAASKAYLILNSTSTSQSVKIVGTGPTTGVTIISGEKALVAWNGSDFVKIASTAAAGGSNTQVQFNNNGVLAGSASLTWDGSTLTTTSVNKVTITAPATSATLTIANGKTFTVNNTLTLAGTDSTTMTFPNASTTVAGLGTTQTFTGINTFTPAARSSGVASYFTLTTPADTGQTASTESIGANFTAATRTWATGALTLQRERVFAAPTYAFAGASTLTTAVNVDIAAPIAGTNATITNAYALRAAASQFTGTVNASGLTASRAVFTDASKNLVSNAITGSGNVVMSASPTLTGTIAAASLQLSSLTSGRVTYATTSGLLTDSSNLAFDGSNLGVGVTPTASWAFGGNVQIQNNLAFTGAFSIVSNAYYGSGSTFRYLNTGGATTVYQTTAAGNQIWGSAAAGTAGNAITFSSAMTLFASGGLSIGNTTDPGSSGIVSATSYLFGSSSNLLYQSATTTATIRVGTTPVYFNFVDNSGVSMISGPSGTLSFGTGAGNSEVARFNSGGTLSVGNSSTQANSLLVVEQGITARASTVGLTPYLQTYNTNAGANQKTWRVGGYSNGDFKFESLDDAYTSASVVLALTNSGNIVYGGAAAVATSVKTFQFPASGSLAWEDNNVGISGNLFYNSAWKYNGAGYGTYYKQNAGKHIWASAPSGSAGATASTTEYMTLDASGRLGIGETNPAYPIHINAGTNPAQIAFQSSISSGISYKIGQGIQGVTNAGLQIYDLTNSAVRLAIDSDGNLLVGDTTSSGRLTVKRSTDGTIGYFDGSTTQFRIDVASSTINLNAQNGTGAMAFQTNGTERARIDSAGYFGIGTASPGTLLDVTGVATNQRTAQFKTNGTTATDIPITAWNTATTGNNTFADFGTEATFTSRGSITYNRTGGLTSFNTTSDYRAKDIIGEVTDPGATIDALKVYVGKMKGATVERPMMIAHEAQAVAPYAVTGEKDAVNKDGDPIYQQMDHQILVPLLIAELQSLRKRVAQLEGK